MANTHNAPQVVRVCRARASFPGLAVFYFCPQLIDLRGLLFFTPLPWVEYAAILVSMLLVFSLLVVVI